MLRVDFLGLEADGDNAPQEVNYGSVVLRDNGDVITLPLDDSYKVLFENVLNTDVVIYDRNDNPKIGYSLRANAKEWMKNAYKQFTSPYLRATKPAVVNEN